jgi:N-hydroxyarylamine O-acetyltransferase
MQVAAVRFTCWPMQRSRAETDIISQVNQESMTTARTDVLPEVLVDQVLTKLGLSGRPELTLDGLSALFAAWSRGVPFDNVRKLIHIRQQNPGPFPGDDSVEFFESWLRHGTGGTCWGTNGSLLRLVLSLGFSAVRGEATMLAAPNAPPNHGTVVVDLDGDRYLIDGTLLQVEPLRLEEDAVTRAGNDHWGVTCAMHDRKWMIRWRPAHAPDGMDCRIERLDVGADIFRDRHEATRPWSPFNYQVYARSVRGDSMLSLSYGERVEQTGNGQMLRSPLDHEGRMRMLVDEFGMSEEIVAQLPPDVPTPPPPWSNTARRAAGSRSSAS